MCVCVWFCVVLCISIYIYIYIYNCVFIVSVFVEPGATATSESSSFLFYCLRCEDHFDLDEYNAALEDLERRWNANNSDPACDKLCRIPAYIHQDSTRSLWSTENAFDIDTALTDGATFKKNFFHDAQFVFSHCHHHWHPKDPRTGERHPIRG